MAATGWNLLVSPVGFLPVFLLIAPIEGVARGVELSGRLQTHVGFFFYFLIGLSGPVALGSLSMSALLVLLPRRLGPLARRACTLGSTLLAPASPMAVWGLGGAAVFLDRPFSTLVACLALGALARVPRRPPLRFGPGEAPH